MGYNNRYFDGTIKDIIDVLLSIIGENGTLCMPVFPLLNEKEKNIFFSVKRTPSISGIITEMFRRMSGVKRSAQFRSVAAFGKNAQYLIKDHHTSLYPSGENSPYIRFAEKKAKVLCLGVGAHMNAMFHCAEDILKNKFPVSVYPSRPKTLSVENENDIIMQIQSFRLKPRWEIISYSQSLLPYFDTNTITYNNLNKIECSLTNAESFLTRLLELARNGKHIFAL